MCTDVERVLCFVWLCIQSGKWSTKAICNDVSDSNIGHLELISVFRVGPKNNAMPNTVNSLYLKPF